MKIGPRGSLKTRTFLEDNNTVLPFENFAIAYANHCSLGIFAYKSDVFEITPVRCCTQVIITVAGGSQGTAWQASVHMLLAVYMLRYNYFIDQQGLRDTQCIVFIHNKQGPADYQTPSLRNHSISSYSCACLSLSRCVSLHVYTTFVSNSVMHDNIIQVCLILYSASITLCKNIIVYY